MKTEKKVSPEIKLHYLSLDIRDRIKAIIILRKIEHQVKDTNDKIFISKEINEHKIELILCRNEMELIISSIL